MCAKFGKAWTFQLSYLPDKWFWAKDKWFWVQDKWLWVQDKWFWVQDKWVWVHDKWLWVQDKWFWVQDKTFSEHVEICKALILFLPYPMTCRMRVENLICFCPSWFVLISRLEFEELALNTSYSVLPIEWLSVICIISVFFMNQ